MKAVIKHNFYNSCNYNRQITCCRWRFLFDQKRH